MLEKTHSHDFVENYRGLVGFGADRETDENTLVYYLQKFADDNLITELVRRMGDQELEELFNLVTRVMKRHLSEPEYHSLFLKDEGHSHTKKD
ncbi:MAG: cytoplasmic protein [Desulfobacterales bacterium]|nr:cytoplasmic protein [Desulfobacterales bacterium]